MALLWDKIYGNAIAFTNNFKNAGSGMSHSQTFVTDFLRVFGVERPMDVGEFEYKVTKPDGTSGFIDYLWKGQIAIEMKSRGKDLKAAFRQLNEYMQGLPDDYIPDLLMVSDFENIRLFRQSTQSEHSFKTRNLHTNIKKFVNIAGYSVERMRDNLMEVNVKAAEKMAQLHDALKLYGYEGYDLEVYLVRLLFCLFAEDTGIFPQDDFAAYIRKSKADGSDLSDRINRLFEILNMDEELRKKRTLLPIDLTQFRYVNGKLFEDPLPSADFNEKMRQTLLDCTDFIWNKISPAIFGAMFQGVIDKRLRRELGAHYTSEENILKLINALFLDDLWKEFEKVKSHHIELDNFHNKISTLKFLDPACGCGNFLIITYRELRQLELEILKMKQNSGQLFLDIDMVLKVNVEQFYGIECEDFPCQIAQVAMWLMDHQMNVKASQQLGDYHVRLPITQSPTIIRANALEIDWEKVVPKNELSYILGNPPFTGSKMQTNKQRSDMEIIFTDPVGTAVKGYKILDYVTAWFYKSAKFIAGSSIKVSFVSTNSICQGEQAATLWKPLIQDKGMKILFAYQTFRWSNDAKGKAAVFCVIIGFSHSSTNNKKIYSIDGTAVSAKNINPYLIDAPDVFIENRLTPLSEAPEIGIGNKPVDDGNYLFSEYAMKEFVKIEPKSKKWFRPWVGADEFVNGYRRWCLWLGDCTPHDLRQMPEVMKRISAVQKFRRASNSVPTQKIAAIPCRFHVENMPKAPFIVIPKVTTIKRLYFPIGFLQPETLASDLLFIMPDANLYHFGILSSNVHAFWVKSVCGRLGNGYRYSKNVVYNNFPWPDSADAQKKEIMNMAQIILDVRDYFTDASLADLYDPASMPRELLKAHQKLDRSVLKAYKMPLNITQESCVATLMSLYCKKAMKGCVI